MMVATFSTASSTRPRTALPANRGRSGLHEIRLVFSVPSQDFLVDATYIVNVY
jgi:hypothetical protein